LPECKVATAWVAENSASLPTTLKELRKYDQVYRKRIFAALPREIKISLWHEQLRYYVASPELSPEQHLLVSLVDATLDSNFTLEAARAIEVRMKPQFVAVLGNELTRKIFYSLGAIDGLSGAQSTLANPNDKKTSPNEKKVGCGCSQIDFYGCLIFSETCVNANCIDTSFGCGFWWLLSCDGACSER